MSTQIVQGADELEAIRVGIELLSKSSNAQELCQRLVHADLMEGMCQGVEIYLLDQRSMLKRLAGYGQNHDFGDQELSAWGDGLLAKAVRTRKLNIEQMENCVVNALPVHHDEVTTGVLVFSMMHGAPVGQLSDDGVSTLSNLFGLYLNVNGFSLSQGIKSKAQGSDEPVNGESLTTRQVQILHLIADGLTNAEIAKVVLLSESTVRQETIRIFRVLSVHNRTDAIVKARANGIISSPAPKD